MRRSAIYYACFLLSLLLFSGCVKQSRIPNCFKLMAVYVNKEYDLNCPLAIFRVEDSPDPSISAGELVVITTGNNYLEYLKPGKVIYMKTIEQPIVVSESITCPEKYKYSFFGYLCGPN